MNPPVSAFAAFAAKTIIIALIFFPSQAKDFEVFLFSLLRIFAAKF